MRNPFTGQPSPRGAPVGDDGHVIKPAGTNLFRMPGVRPSHHCNEGEWDLQAMGEKDMRDAEAHRREGMQRGGRGSGPRDGRP